MFHFSKIPKDLTWHAQEKEFDGKSYEYTIEYHQGKVNVVTDALSRKPTGSISHLKAVYLPRFMELRSLSARLELTDIGALLATFHVSPVLIDKIREL